MERLTRFASQSEEWLELEKLIASDRSDIGFASSVSTHAGVYVVGASGEKTNAGSTYVFRCTELPCEGDANDDGVVDPMDAGFIQARFGCPVGTGDLECDASDQSADGAIDPLDVGYVLARFGNCP